MAAFLDGFDLPDITIRNLFQQKIIFIICFLFLNFYVILHLFFSSFFADYIIHSKAALDIKNSYKYVLNSRSLIGFALLVAWNLSFFFTNYFRFISAVGFAYLLNATIDVITIFGPYIDTNNISVSAAFFIIRPLSLASVLVCTLFFDPNK